MKRLPRFCPVIHVTNSIQAQAQARIAFENGADGVFLIDHEKPYTSLQNTYIAVRRVNPSAWIGLNFLDLRPAEAIRAFPSTANGLWIDNGGIQDEYGTHQPAAAAISDLAAQHGAGQAWRLFAGVDFKYQHSAKSPAEAARLAGQYYQVPTTSGPGTGEAASLEKIAAMKAALVMGDRRRPLALASGVTVENVLSFAPFVDCFMVATGISASFDRFNPALVRHMANLLESRVFA
jgi:hypothetical protein